MITVGGVEEAQRALAEIAAGIDEITEETLSQVGLATLHLVRTRTPIRTGRLINNHRMQVTGPKSMRMWNDTEYAGFVEFGTSKMLPRPHWRPAIEALKKSLPQLFAEKAQDLVDDSVRKNAGPV